MLQTLLKIQRSVSSLHSAATRAFANQAIVVVQDMVDTRRSSSRQQQQHDAADTAEPPLPSLDQALHNLRNFTYTEPSEPVSAKHAAVLVPLFELDGQIHVILTQRNSKMRSHAGEVCFPGGKREKDDVDDAATALREAHEELGLEPTSVQVACCLQPVLSKHLLSVTPVIARIPANLQFMPNDDEVEHVFSAPLRMFLKAGPCYSYRDVEWENFPYRLHYWNYSYKGEREFLIWGLTAGIGVMVAEQAFGRKAEFDVLPPGAVVPYTSLAFEKGKLVSRGGPSGASAAVPGAVVMVAEAEAALGSGNSSDGDNDDDLLIGDRRVGGGDT